MTVILEQETDRVNEERARKHVRSVWGWPAQKLDLPMYKLDWMFKFEPRRERGKIHGWGEFKQRTGVYTTVILSLAKAIRGVTWSQQTGLPFYFIVEFVDRGGVYKYAQIKSIEGLSVEWGGREDRDPAEAPHDMEPVVHIPYSWFKTPDPDEDNPFLV